MDSPLKGGGKLFGGIAYLGAYLLAVYSWSSASIHWHAWHIFPRADCRKNWLVILLPMPVLIAILPNIIAVESAWHAMQAKLSPENKEVYRRSSSVHCVFSQVLTELSMDYGSSAD